MFEKLLAIVLVDVVAFFGCGCIDATQVDSVSEVVEPTAPPRAFTQIVESNDDAVFVELAVEMLGDMSRYLTDFEKALSNKDIINAHTAARRLESLANVYIEDIGELKVTEDMEQGKVLTLKTLDELRLGAQHFQTGLSSYELSTVDMGELNNGVAHLKTAQGYTRELQKWGKI